MRTLLTIIVLMVVTLPAQAADWTSARHTDNQIIYTDKAYPFGDETAEVKFIGDKENGGVLVIITKRQCQMWLLSKRSVIPNMRGCPASLTGRRADEVIGEIQATLPSDAQEFIRVNLTE